MARSEAGDEGARRRSALGTAGLLVLFAVPVLVAVVALRDPRWYPTVDMAQTEMRVRDVFSAHPPLLGLRGRIASYGVNQGSHLGPISFYALAPVHWLLGRGSWALQVSSLVVHLGAVATTLWVARRRGGLGLVLGMAAVLAIVMRAFGAQLLSEAWNPYLPVLWWGVFLLAVWSVACDDLALLPLAVGAGSFCVQTHVSYIGPVFATALVAVVAVALRLRAGRHRPRAPRTEGQPRDGRWALIALGVGLLGWLPPVIEQVATGREGNLSKVVNYFRYSTEPTLGGREGIGRLLFVLDPWRLLTNQTQITGLPARGSIIPGLLLVAVWVAAVIVAWRRGHRDLLRLHLVLGVALVAGGLSLSRVIGAPWNYLSLWVWCLGALMLLAIGWTVAVAVVASVPGAATSSTRTIAALVPAAVATAFVALLVGDAASVPVIDESQSTLIGGLAPSVTERLAADDVPGGGRSGRFLVTGGDLVYTGAPIFGLVNELERDGFDVGMEPFQEVAVRQHRVLAIEDATAVVHFSTGSDIVRWRAKQAAVEVAYFDPRDAEERRRSEGLQGAIATSLRRAGLDELAAGTEDIAVIENDPRIDPVLRLELSELRALGVPAAVFVAPPTTR